MGVHRRYSLVVDQDRRGEQRAVFTAGVHVMGSRWLVNGSRQGLVQLTMDPPVPASVWWKSITLKVLVLSVTDPDALIAACIAPAR